jgi:hypothetical protein
MTDSEPDLRKIAEEMGVPTASVCFCGHPRQAHYPATNWMTGCKVEDCDCLEFEGV